MKCHMTNLAHTVGYCERKYLLSTSSPTPRQINSMETNMSQYFRIKNLQNLLKACVIFLTLYAPTPQNGQTHSNSLPAKTDELFDHFEGLALEGLRLTYFSLVLHFIKK